MWVLLGVWYLTFSFWTIYIAVNVTEIDHFVLLLIGSYFLADAGSYIFHYIVDHFGSANRAGIVREFQNHHAAPSSILTRSLSDVLSPAIIIVTPCLVGLWVLTWFAFVPIEIAFVLYVLASCWVYAQLFHRWSHQRQKGVIGILQKLGLILSYDEHMKHHAYPFMTNFAVINGWSNKLFDAIQLPKAIDRALYVIGVEKRSTLLVDVKEI